MREIELLEGVASGGEYVGVGGWGQKRVSVGSSGFFFLFFSSS